MNNAKAYKGMAMEGPIAAWYARVTRREVRHRQEAERVVGRIPSGGRVLEIAPGPGYFAIELARLGNFQVTGVDISQSFVEIARRNAAEAGVQVDFRQGNASDLPFEAESFDFTYCQAAFKNFTQPVKAIAEMYRVLRPHGVAAIVDLRSDASPQEIERYVESLRLSPINRLVTRWTFRNMLLKNAYTASQMKGFVLQTPFLVSKVEVDNVGFTLWLEK
jgi:ubiquinone/menaquinone biosynthesis C-methylase UbiE